MNIEENIKNNFSIDVIMPNYNKANYLEDSIQSVISQSLKNWNLFIIDDNSTDNSWKVIELLKTSYIINKDVHAWLCLAKITNKSKKI